MKKSTLMVCAMVILFVASYPANDALAAMTVHQFVTDQKVTLDDNTGNYWYWSLSDFSDMTYSQQITAIENLGTYGGLTEWHMADNDEMFALWDSYSAEDIRDNFGPSGTKGSTLWWGGRYDEVSTVNVDHHWVCQVTEDMKYPFPSGDIPDGSPISWYGAWIVTSDPTPIPVPGAITLGSIGVGFICWLRKRRAL